MVNAQSSPFNAAELSIQHRLGIAERLDAQVSNFIRPEMPEQHQTFYQSLPMAILGVVDEQGAPWAVPVFGRAGFIQTPNAQTLNFGALPALSEALTLDLTLGQKLGMLGIELPTRRRNRVNGVISNRAEGEFSITVDQSYGNCPQYIQKRNFELDLDALDSNKPPAITQSHELSNAVKSVLESADTFFIASRSAVFADDPRSGIDASHRGGKRGFVKVTGNRLKFPDFSGNKFFNTLSNIEDDGRVGLLFPDFDTGNAILIKGRAHIDWDESQLDNYQGAERFVVVDCDEIIEAEALMPIKTRLIEYSPSLIGTGDWLDKKTNAAFKPFRLAKKVQESDSVTSFYFQPEDYQSLPVFEAGQFIPIRTKSHITGEWQQRSYTISQMDRQFGYRISVKRERNGLVSRLLHDHLVINDTIEIGHPAGKFTLVESKAPIVMLSSGVGITPMITFLEARIAMAKHDPNPPHVYFYHANKNADQFAFQQYLSELAGQYSWLHVYVALAYQQTDFQLQNIHISNQRLSIEALKSTLGFGGYHFYLCGSESFMQYFHAGLTELGIAKNHIHYEFFGGGSIESEASPKVDSRSEPIALPEQADVTFSLSQKKLTWLKGNLLELAESANIAANFSCRNGQCGACEVKINQGQVRYPIETDYQPEEGHALLCSAIPADDEGLELEL